MLEAELRQDRHLWFWQASQARKLVRRNEALVQQWCAKLCDRYGAIAFEDLSVKLLKEQPGWLGDVVARGVQVLAPGRVRQLARQSAAKRGRAYVEVETKNTTRACAACGHLRDGDLAADRVACEACGASAPPWETAGRNILRRAQLDLAAAARSADDEANDEVNDESAGSGGGRKQSSRWGRRRKIPVVATATVESDASALDTQDATQTVPSQLCAGE